MTGDLVKPASAFRRERAAAFGFKPGEIGAESYTYEPKPGGWNVHLTRPANSYERGSTSWMVVCGVKSVRFGTFGKALERAVVVAALGEW